MSRKRECSFVSSKKLSSVKPNYRAEDINELADELSVILAAKMNRKAAAF